MKILSKDFKKGKVKVRIENPDDLWYLSTIVDNGDIVSALTERKIKLGGEEQRNAKVIRKKLRLKVVVEKVQFSASTTSLRISGKISEGTDDVSAGDYHTLDVAEGDNIDIDKGQKGFLKYQTEKIEDAAKNVHTNTLVCALDRGEATFAIIKKYGYEVIGNIKGDFEKKDYKENVKSDFFNEVAKNAKEYVQRYSINTIIFGTVPFWKENAKKEIDSMGLGVKIIYVSCNSAGDNGINEIMKNDDAISALKNERFAIESHLVNELLSGISKGSNVAYGMKEVAEAAKVGAVDKLMVTDGIIKKKREDEKYQEIEDIMRKTDMNNGNIVIVSSEHDAGKQLDGLGGMAAMLRFKI